MVKVVCAIIIDTDKKILLTRRSAKMSHPGKWEFPGGKVKQEEDIGEAIEREIQEELDLEVHASFELKAVQWSYDDKHIQLIPIFCRPMSGNLKLREHDEAKWFSLKELRKMSDLLDADKEILIELESLIKGGHFIKT